MKQISYLILTICTSLALVGCVDDNIMDTNATASPFDESDIIDTKLGVSVNEFTLSVNGTRADGDKDNEEPTEDAVEIMSDFEKTIDNIWVFQYDATTSELLIKPRYYTAEASETGGSWDVVLKPVESTIYVVANVNSDSWASEYTNFMTVDNGLLLQSLPFPRPLYDFSETSTQGHIPMQGCAAKATPGGSDDIIVPVEHMYAKVKMRVLLDNDLDVYYAYINNVSFGNIPWYCRIGTLYEGTVASMDDEYTSSWISRSFTEVNNTDDPNNEGLEDGFTYDYVIYIPENIQGEVTTKDSEDKDEKGTDAPEHACTMSVDIGYVDEGGVQESAVYTVYPGGNEWNNYNIRRNQVYRVTMEIGYPLYATNQPSANCIVGHPGTTISFEPYYRIEEGGGYNFSDYLDPDSNPIKGYKILWQTQDCIGDNSEGKLVTFEKDEENPIHSKFYVTVNQPGNAVIAAYDDDDCEGNIIWSWHIWVTEEDPTNIGNAIVYYTYQWDDKNIYGKDSGEARVPGYGCMPCNLGALTSTPKSYGSKYADRVEAYGLMYQWGRKDPFPALKKYAAAGTNIEYGHYTDDTADDIYDNSHTAVHITDQENENYLFHPISGNIIVQNNYGIEYTISHPTVFMCGTTLAGVSATEASSSNVNNQSKYHNTGDWLPSGQSDDRLWGASEVTAETMSLYVGTDNYSSDRYLRDDYGEKSIFDPCPYGWRVSPPDQWLGFTDTGFNPINSMDEVNYDSSTSTTNYGMSLYIQEWRSGATSWFPCQGMISPDGGGSHNRSCGNYHNATADTDNRVNILHVHNSISNFRIFEIRFYNYYVKSVAGPVRCVRDTK